MIWMTWRQFRTQALAGIAVAALLDIYLLILGLQVHHSYTSDLAQCRKNGGCSDLQNSLVSHYDFRISLLGYVLVVVPGLLGVFWSAPLITRELESGTHQLAWNQSVTRGTWLAAKLAVVGPIGVAVTGLYSMLLTWAASPLDQIRGNRFSPLLFDARNITPIAYAAFAFVLGVALGLVIRRTVPTMAVTLVVFAVVQIVMPTLVRPSYASPTTTTVQLTAQTVDSLSFFGEYGAIDGLKIPQSWVLSTSPMLNAQGQDVGHTAMYARCVAQTDMGSCFGSQNLHVQVSEQPAGRYWDFQWYETAIFAVLAALIAGFCFWRIRGRLS